MPEHTHARLMSNATGASHSKNEMMLEKTCATYPTSPQKKNKQGKQKLHFWSFSRVYKGRGINSCFHDSHTHSAAMEEASFLLGFILMLQAPFHWNITYSLCYPSALLHPLLSFLCSTFNSYPSFLPLAECTTQSSLCLAPKLPPDKTFPLERTTGRGEEEKKGGKSSLPEQQKHRHRVTYWVIGHAQIDRLLQEGTDERHGGTLESACKWGEKTREVCEKKKKK